MMDAHEAAHTIRQARAKATSEIESSSVKVIGSTGLRREPRANRRRTCFPGSYQHTWIAARWTEDKGQRMVPGVKKAESCQGRRAKESVAHTGFNLAGSRVQWIKIFSMEIFSFLFFLQSPLSPPLWVQQNTSQKFSRYRTRDRRIHSPRWSTWESTDVGLQCEQIKSNLKA